MAFFSRKKKPAEEAKPEVKAEPAAAKQPKQEKAAKKDVGDAYQYLVKPVLSEKGTHLASSGRYVFAVSDSANKNEIRKSVQRIYDVHVTSVRIVKMPPKKRRYGRTIGQTSAWKKAIVTLKEGEKIPGIIEAVG